MAVEIKMPESSTMYEVVAKDRIPTHPEMEDDRLYIDELFSIPVGRHHATIAFLVISLEAQIIRLQILYSSWRPAPVVTPCVSTKIVPQYENSQVIRPRLGRGGKIPASLCHLVTVSYTLLRDGRVHLGQ